MKRHLKKFILLAAAAIGFTTAAHASDRWETLRAINWVENPTNRTQPGRFGELGPYQFRQTTWRMHTTKSFSLANQRAVADEVAVKHYEWIRRALEQAGVDANVFNIAMAWNCGVDTVVKGRAPDASYHYAERVSNLVATFKERSSPEVAEEKVIEEKSPARVPDWIIDLDEHNEELRFRVPNEGPRFVLAAD